MRNLITALLAMLLCACGAAEADVNDNAGQTAHVYPPLDDYSDVDQTIVRDTLARGPSFFHDYAVVQLTCGYGCSYGQLIDLRDGSVADLPYAAYAEGDDPEAAHSNLDYVWTLESDLIEATWDVLNTDGEPVSCVRSKIRWTGSKFVELSKTRAQGACR